MILRSYFYITFSIYDLSWLIILHFKVKYTKALRDRRNIILGYASRDSQCILQPFNISSHHGLNDILNKIIHIEL